MGALSIGLGGTGRHSFVDFPLRGVDRTAVDGPWSGPAFPWAPLPPALGSSDGRSAGGSVWCLRAEGVVFPVPPDGDQSYPTAFPRGRSSVEPLRTRCPFRLPFPGRSVGLVPRRFGRGFVGRTGPAVRWRPLPSGVGSVHRSLHPCLALSDAAGTWRLSCGLLFRAGLHWMLARSRRFGGGGLAGARSARAGGTRGPSGVPRRTLCSLHDSRDGFCPCWTGLRGVVCPACSAARALPRWRALSGPVARKAHLSGPEPRSVGRGAGDGAFGRPGVRHEGAREIKGYRRDLSRRPLGSQPSILTTKTKLRYEIRISGFCLSGSCPLDEPGLILESPSVVSGGGRTGRRACRRGLFESSSTGSD